MLSLSLRLDSHRHLPCVNTTQGAIFAEACCIGGDVIDQYDCCSHLCFLSCLDKRTEMTRQT